MSVGVPSAGGGSRRAIELEAFTGEVASLYQPVDPEPGVARLVDPASATETLHWGRNYLYRTVLETTAGPVDVVVKQFRNQGWRAVLRRRLKGSKALLSWRMAWRFQEAGVPTAEPVLWLESRRADGPSFFVTRYLEGVTEARYLLRAANQDRVGADFPEIDYEGFLAELGRRLRRMHEAGLWHRDLSIGNVLLRTGLPAEDASLGGPRVPELFIVDLNRARSRRRLSLSQRTRDLCRLALFRRHDQEALLRAYWGEDASGYGFKRWLYRLYHRGFLRKIETKKRLRGGFRGLRDLFRVRRSHAHIPPPPEHATARDKIVWDHLSDQPHQHAGKAEKLMVRLADAGGHAEAFAALVGAAPRIWRRYRHLQRELYRRPVPLGALGVGLRPYPEDPAALLEAIDELGVRHALLRLHPWQEEHDAEEELARELRARGVDLAFSLPQNRELVKDPERWRRSLETLAERFVPYGRSFQVGQAVNRSKWGIWNPREYAQLANVASEVLRGHGSVELLGPSVIDFEYHATAALLHLRRFDTPFDAVAALLYVDRRGAPENRQAGLDTVDKVVLLRAIAETARNSGERCWITEVNWPLWEGPHSPAGRDVSVDEESQADFLVRYALLALGTGLVERVYWWQLVARGYGLATPTPGGLRRRPSFRAMATLLRCLRGATFLGPLEAPDGARLYRFEIPGGTHTVVGWSTAGEISARLPRPPARVFGRDGEEIAAPGSDEVEIGPSPRYFLLEEGP